jgi:hypothetical protein
MSVTDSMIRIDQDKNILLENLIRSTHYFSRKKIFMDDFESHNSSKDVMDMASFQIDFHKLALLIKTETSYYKQ